MNYLLKSAKSSMSLHSKINSTSSIFRKQCSAFAASIHDAQLTFSNSRPFKILTRSIGHYFIHPEKMKQLIKAKDAHALCNYIASEKYQKKLQEMVEKQKRKVFDDFPEGVPVKEMKFQHIINCAQPTPVIKLKSNHENQDEEEEEEIRLPVIPKKRRKVIKTTIMSVMLKKKQAEEKDLYWKYSSSIPTGNSNKKKPPERKSKLRKRTTILPIFLKKMQDRTIKERYEENGRNAFIPLQNDHGSIGGESYDEEKNVDTFHTRSNLKGHKEGVRNLTTSAAAEHNLPEPVTEVEINNNDDFEHQTKDLNFPNTDLELSPEKNKEMHELFSRHREDTRKTPMAKSVVSAKKPSRCVQSKIRHNYSRRRPRIKCKKQEFLSSNSEMNLPINGHFEIDGNLCAAIETRHLFQESDLTCDNVSLFNRVKKENQTKPLKLETKKYDHKDPSPVWKHYRSEPSLTHHIVQERLNQENFKNCSVDFICRS